MNLPNLVLKTGTRKNVFIAVLSISWFSLLFLISLMSQLNFMWLKPSENNLKNQTTWVAKFCFKQVRLILKLRFSGCLAFWLTGSNIWYKHSRLNTRFTRHHVSNISAKIMRQVNFVLYYKLRRWQVLEQRWG